MNQEKMGNHGAASTANCRHTAGVYVAAPRDACGLLFTEADSPHAAGVCPSEDLLFAFLDGDVDAKTQLEMLRHLSTCEKCGVALSEIVAAMNAVEDTLRRPALSEFPDAHEWDLATDRMFEDLRDAGIVSSKIRADLREVARVVGRGAALGVEFVASFLWTGAKAAYSRRQAISRIATGAGKVAGAIVRLGAWGLARS